MPLDLPPQPTAPPLSEPISEPEKYPDLIEGIFPASQLHLIGGSRGAGKTAMEVWLEYHVLNDLPFLGHKTNRPPWWGCLIFDRSEEDRLMWWERAGLTGRVPYYSLTMDKGMLPKDLAKMGPGAAIIFLEEKVAALKAPRGGVLTIDVANFFTSDSNMSYRSSFAYGWALGKIAHDNALTIIAVMHGGKQKAGQQYLRLTDRIIASTGFLGAASTVSYLTTKEEAADHDLQAFAWEPHHHPAEHFKFRRTELGFFEVAEKSDSPLPPSESAEGFMRELPLTGDMIVNIPPVGQPVEPGQRSRSHIYKILKKLRDSGLIETWEKDGVTYVRRKKRENPS